jgi:cysteine sulfinate desulfinase/cysteine desulfurase-like protein
MRYPEELAQAGVRVSLTPAANPEEVEAFTLAWRGIHARLRRVRAA